jgi:hypothetical protein
MIYRLDGTSIELQPLSTESRLHHAKQVNRHSIRRLAITAHSCLLILPLAKARFSEIHKLML